jgi:Ni/Fe-hydrogenase subunit HybB-like protein
MAVSAGLRPSREGLIHAALAPQRHPGKTLKAVAVLLGLVALAGLAAYGYQLVDGIGVTALNDEVFWGIYTVDLVAFIGFSYGGALVSAILRLTGASWRGPITRIAEGTALVTLAVGALFPVIHLGHPERVWEFFTQPQLNSPLLWDMVAILTYLLVTVFLFTVPLIPDLAIAETSVTGWRRRLYGWLSNNWRGTVEQERVLGRAITILAILVIPVAVMVHTVLSYAFSLTSRPGWFSTIFGPYFVVAAIYSGVAVVILAAVFYRRIYRLEQWIEERALRYLSYLMIALGALYGYFTFTEITTEGYVGEESAANVLFAILLRDYALGFWIFVALALVAPILIVAWPRTRTPFGMGIASALVIVGMFLKRYLIVVPPLTQPLVGEEVGSYFPGLVEILVTAGAAAGMILLLIGLFRVFPVLGIHEMTELDSERIDAASASELEERKST